MIGSYLHASPSPGLGKMGALVALRDRGGSALEGAIANRAQVRLSRTLCNVRTAAGRIVPKVSCCMHACAQPEWSAVVLPGVGRRWRPEQWACMRLQELGSKLAMHVVAARPLYLDRQSVPEDALAGAGLHPPGCMCVHPRQHAEAPCSAMT